MSAAAREPRGMTAFGVVWSGQLLSLMGSQMTAFALGVWVFQRTGSATLFALIAFFAVLPGIIGLPFLGVLVDRWGARRAMIVADAGEGVCVLLVLALLQAQRLSLPAIYFVSAASAVFAALRWPAYSTLPTMLVAPRHLGRANGLVHVSEGIADISAPLVAGFLVVSAGLGAVMALDLLTFVIGIVTVLAVRTPEVAQPADGDPGAELVEEGATFIARVTYGWRYIRRAPGLWGLLVFFALANFVVLGSSRALATPLILGESDARTLGVILAISGGAYLAGAALLSAWGGPARRVRTIIGLTIVQALALALAGATVNLVVTAVGLVVLALCFPLVTGTSQALWQTLVPVRIQGRVFAVRRMIGWSAFPIAYLAFGPLADRVFVPWLGHARGIGAIFVACGLLGVVVAAVAYAFPPIRHLEDEMTAPTPATCAGAA